MINYAGVDWSRSHWSHANDRKYDGVAPGYSPSSAGKIFYFHDGGSIATGFGERSCASHFGGAEHGGMSGRFTNYKFGGPTSLRIAVSNLWRRKLRWRLFNTLRSRSDASLFYLIHSPFAYRDLCGDGAVRAHRGFGSFLPSGSTRLRPSRVRKFSHEHLLATKILPPQ